MAIRNPNDEAFNIYFNKEKEDQKSKREKVIKKEQEKYGLKRKRRERRSKRKSEGVVLVEEDEVGACLAEGGEGHLCHRPHPHVREQQLPWTPPQCQRHRHRQPAHRQPLWHLGSINKSE